MMSMAACVAMTVTASGATAQPGLTGTETRWLGAGAAVLDYARQIGLPVDVIVQPQPAPGAVPLAMGFSGGRCKLVLSMRDNARTDDVLERVPPAQHGVLIEAMTAHEIGHCWRYAQGNWHSVPSGFVEAGEEGFDPAVLAQLKAMRDTRREEGFADLAALAWIWQRHPDDYARVYAWMAGLRQGQPLASHATLAWIGLARDGAVFGAGGTPFAQAEPLWSQGLSGDKAVSWSAARGQQFSFDGSFTHR